MSCKGAYIHSLSIAEETCVELGEPKPAEILRSSSKKGFSERVKVLAWCLKCLSFLQESEEEVNPRGVLTRGGLVSESSGKSDAQLAIESFVDRMKDIHPDLDQEEFHNAVSEYVQQAVSEADEGEES